MKYVKMLMIVLVLSCAICGCQNQQKKDHEVVMFYQVADDGTGLKSSEYRLTSDYSDAVDVVKELLDKYEKVDIRDFQIKEKQLSLYFSSAYENFQGVDEVLMRAALVKTLCQVQGVEYVEFFVENTSLVVNGEPVGVMSDLSFLDSIGGEGYTQEKYVTLYFADQSGLGMKEVNAKITYDMTVPLARLLLEKLIEGPEALTDVNTSDLRKTIPEGTVINSMTIRDNVCYVDFSKEFENLQLEVKSEIVIYSIVNTLSELADVNKVQFTIEGEQKEVYGDTEGFNIPFERNLDLVSGGSKG